MTQNEDMPAMENESQEAAPQGDKKKGLIITIVLAVLIAAAGGGVLYGLMATKPEAKKKKPDIGIETVRVVALARQTYPVEVSAMGTIEPSRKIALGAQVSGKIVWVSEKFVPGGRFAAGEEIIKIERDDYDLVVRQRAADLESAEHALREEKGKGELAKIEYALLETKEKLTPEEEALVFRTSHLAKAVAAVDAARAVLEKAELDAERTVVRAPFAAVILDRNVELGALVSAQTQLATLAGTKKYWIEVSIPQEQIKWLTIPKIAGDVGSSVIIEVRQGGDDSFVRSGKVVGLLAALEPEGRMARLLVEIADPLLLKPVVDDAEAEEQDAGDSDKKGMQPLLLVSYVNVRMVGQELKDVFVIPRTALHDGVHVWIMGADDKLVVRRVKSVWKGRDVVVVQDNLKDGERLVVSNISTPIPGMRLRLEATKSETDD